MQEHELTLILLTIAILVVSFISLFKLLSLDSRMTPRVKVHAFLGIVPEALSANPEEWEHFLELTARNENLFPITITGFYAELRGRQFGDPLIPIEGSGELVSLNTDFPCRLDQGDWAKISRLVRDDLIDLSDPKQIEYIVATDSCGRDWKSERWPLRRFLPFERVISRPRIDERYVLINSKKPK